MSSSGEQPASDEFAPQPSGHELIGIDVGGTKVLAVRVRTDRGGSVPTVVDSLEVASDAGGAGVLRAIVGAAGELVATGGPVDAIGVGLAGFVDTRGVVRIAPNTAGLVDVDVGAEVSARLGVPCVVDNDANCVAVAAHAALGSDRSVTNLVAVTLGTGIGGGLIVDGELVRGGRGFAGEPGHVVVDPDGPRCPCGQRGCWERFASGSALAASIAGAVDSGRLDRAEVPTDTGVDLLDAVRRGVPAAQVVFEEFAAWVALGVAGLIAVLDPHVVAIGGGLSAMGDDLVAAVERQLDERHALVVREPAPRIVVAPGGPAAGAIGAAVLAGRRLGPEGPRA